MSASDDFSGASLDTGLWNLEGPSGVSGGIATSASDSFLELVTPDGNFDAWGTNNSARAMQDIADDDFTLEARFLSVPTERFQLQGFIVEADANNWLRFDTYSDGNSLKAFAAVTTNGSSSARINLTIPAGEAPYLKITRSGDLWSYEYSQDGANWTTAGSFTAALGVTSAGVFGGNVQQATGFTAQVDYVELGTDPIANEDAGFTPQNNAPDASDDAFGLVTDTSLDLTIASDLLGNDSDADGDPLTVTALGSAANGTVTDNADGTITYTPNAGYEGADSFTYTISDGEDTDTATVNLTVSGGGSAPGFNSDDFSGASLDTGLWNLEGPSGVSGGIATSASDSFLELVTPDGNFDAWGTNNSARAMQDIADDDFTLEARFLSVPTERFQLQGFIVEADANNWLRFDTYSDGNSLKAFAAVTTNGSSSARINLTIPAGEAPYLKITRSGDLWSYEYSQDGANWTTAGSFTAALGVTSAGVFGGNVQQATGFTAQVDYVELGTDPIANEDAGFTPQNNAPDASDDAFGLVTDTSLNLTIASDLLGNDSDADGDPLTVTALGSAANGTVTDNADGTITYTPNAGYEGADSFTYTISDGEDTDTATVNLTVSGGGSAPGFNSDDFSGASLDTGLWNLEGPSGVSGGIATSASDSFLELVTPDGNFDAWGTNNSARAMQDIADDDFTLEARFLSVPTERFQLQGFIVEADANNWLRFDTYSDGNSLKAFAAVTTNGSSSARINLTIPAGEAPYLKITRSGDLWSYEYSQDGANWTTAGSFTAALGVTSAGVFGGNVQQATGFTAQVDYVELGTDPIANEDAGFTPQNNAPDASDDAFGLVTDTSLDLTIASDLLGNDSDADGDPLTVTALGSAANGTVTDNADGTITYTPNAGYEGADSFTYTISDGEDTDTATVNLTVSGGGSAPGFNSDDFSGASLDTGLWNLEGPSGVSGGIATSASDSFLELVTPDGNFDAWGTNNSARAMQDIADDDFTLEARFLSVPTERFQLQGFIVEADANNWLRFDTYSDGNSLKAFAAVTTNGSSSAWINLTIPAGEAPYLKITRSGDLWSYEYSQDGANWTTAGSFTAALGVTSAGVFGGNVQQATGFTAQVDYVELGTDPIANEDAGFTPQNNAPDASDDAFGLVTDTSLDLTIASDLLGNDSDADGDPLTVTALGSAANGTVTDNADGTITYTPNAGYEGADSFTYTISDGEDTDTATVNLTVSGGGSAPGFNSDDFSGASLDTGLWNLEGPSGVSGGIATSASDSFLELVTPDGNFDAWGTNNSARAMQDIADDDFTLEARFLSVPTERFQLQGFIVEADANNWLRFDTYSDGNSLKAFAAVTTNGSSSAWINLTIPAGEAPYLKITRSGDLWSYEYSQDGANWTTAGSFTAALGVTSAGVFGGNVQQATGFTAQVDYVELGTDPIANEDAGFTPQNNAPDASDDAFGLVTDTSLDLTIASDLLGNDSDADGDPLTVTALGSAANGTVTDNADGTITYTPNAGYEGADSFTYTISDGEDSDTATVNLVISQPSTGDFVSDDFIAGVLNTNIWRVEGPSGVSAVAATTAADAVLELITPDGNFDAWGTNNTARAMQDIQNNDFLIETRIVSVPTDRFQIQGLLIEQDANNWLRFDTVSDGANLRAFAAITTNGSPNAQISVTIPGGEAPYLRVDRTGDTWTFDYSLDGANWVNAGSFNHAMTVTAAGVFAGNVQQAEGFTAKVDYVEIDRDPIPNEDDGFVPVNIAPVANEDDFVALTDQSISINVALDLLANDTDENEDPIVLTSLGTPSNGTLIDNGNGTLSYTPDSGFQGFDSFDYMISDGELSDTGTASIFVGDKLQVWYGDTQKFGNVGEAQTFINILGNIYTEDLVSLSYTLNGGASRVLTVGPDNARLENEGDFNVDIAYTELDGTSTDDVVTITATYQDQSVETKDVTIEYEDGVDWPADYSIDWSTVTDIQDVTQVVDGKWELTGDGIRPVETGYDRFVILGDETWDFYEARTSVTLNDISADLGLVGFALWWNGHTNDPIAGRQPLTGFNPSDLLFYNGAWAGTPHFELYRNIADTAYTMLEGRTYNFVIRAEQANQFDRLYSMKVWEDGEAEPVDWLIEHVIDHDVPVSGAFGFVTHLYDVTYHDIDVTEIEGSDIIKGTDAADILIGTDGSAPTPGIDEIDVFVGNSGADLFVFGESGAYFYDEGTAGAGLDDYGYIWDFETGIDQIQLGGALADYVLSENATGLPTGTAIWKTGGTGEQDELIGVVNDVYGMNLASSDFIFDDVGV